VFIVQQMQTTDIAKMVSEAWRELKPDEKERWEERARQDKARFEVEKAMYKGPWKIPANKRAPKDPNAPKRPMSAFLAFSNKRRASLKRETPDASNADLSKMLSQQWKEAPEAIKKKYIEEESGLRETYKREMGKWRVRVTEEKRVERKERESIAMAAAEARQQEIANAAAEGRQPFFGPGTGGIPGESMPPPGQGPDMSAAMQSMYGHPYFHPMSGYPGMMPNPFSPPFMPGMTSGSAPPPGNGGSGNGENGNTGANNNSGQMDPQAFQQFLGMYQSVLPCS
jgi:HMG (high mobility group) box